MASEKVGEVHRGRPWWLTAEEFHAVLSDLLYEHANNVAFGRERTETEADLERRILACHSELTAELSECQRALTRCVPGPRKDGLGNKLAESVSRAAENAKEGA